MKEKQFEEILCRYPELLEEGLTLHGSQVRVRGKIVDLLSKDRYGQKLIVELKQGPIRREHIAQLLDYEGEFLSPDDPTIRVMLVGNRVPPNLRRALDHHGFEWKELPFEHLLSFLRQKGDSQFLKYFETENVTESDPKSKELPGKAPEESIKPAFRPEGFYFEERRYSLESRFEGKPKSVRELFDKFHASMQSLSNQLRQENFPGIWARTHKWGVTYFATRNKAFIFVDFAQHHLSLNLFTGTQRIPGVPKSDWLSRGDNAGGRIQVRNEKDLKFAVKAANSSYRIAADRISMAS